MEGYFLQNLDGEYLQKLDTENGDINFTKDIKEACNYIGRPGGGRWDAENELQFINYHFKDKYGDKVTTLHCVYERICT